MRPDGTGDLAVEVWRTSPSWTDSFEGEQFTRVFPLALIFQPRASPQWRSVGPHGSSLYEIDVPPKRDLRVFPLCWLRFWDDG